MLGSELASAALYTYCGALSKTLFTPTMNDVLPAAVVKVYPALRSTVTLAPTSRDGGAATPGSTLQSPPAEVRSGAAHSLKLPTKRAMTPARHRDSDQFVPALNLRAGSAPRS